MGYFKKKNQKHSEHKESKDNSQKTETKTKPKSRFKKQFDKKNDSRKPDTNEMKRNKNEPKKTSKQMNSSFDSTETNFKSKTKRKNKNQSTEHEKKNEKNLDSKTKNKKTRVKTSTNIYENRSAPTYRAIQIKRKPRNYFKEEPFPSDHPINQSDAFPIAFGNINPLQIQYKEYQQGIDNFIFQRTEEEYPRLLDLNSFDEQFSRYVKMKSTEKKNIPSLTEANFFSFVITNFLKNFDGNEPFTVIDLANNKLDEKIGLRFFDKIVDFNDSDNVDVENFIFNVEVLNLSNNSFEYFEDYFLPLEFPNLKHVFLLGKSNWYFKETNKEKVRKYFFYDHAKYRQDFIDSLELYSEIDIDGVHFTQGEPSICFYSPDELYTNLEIDDFKDLNVIENISKFCGKFVENYQNCNLLENQCLYETFTEDAMILRDHHHFVNENVFKNVFKIYMSKRNIKSKIPYILDRFEDFSGFFAGMIEHLTSYHFRILTIMKSKEFDGLYKLVGYWILFLRDNTGHETETKVLVEMAVVIEQNEDYLEQSLNKDEENIVQNNEEVINLNDMGKNEENPNEEDNEEIHEESDEDVDDDEDDEEETFVFKQMKVRCRQMRMVLLPNRDSFISDLFTIYYLTDLKPIHCLLLLEETHFDIRQALRKYTKLRSDEKAYMSYHAN
eukprot:TRINITY_DN3295_c2_g1_i1.p1 TRINITY_DN3295_c2_g1~~TRINITY_DN3295_c2_g1_i1.p1  ORF type:complete len:677 (+),score=234.15 TRINITY_DN3295_c2_g1_i1:31-2031(+)